MNFVVTTLLYIIIAILSVIFVNKNIKNNKLKISLLAIFIISILFALYNLFCTELSLIVHNGQYKYYDRNNYLIEFLGLRKTSLGLTMVFELVKFFSNNFKVVLYLSTFLSCFITFLAFKKSKDSNTYSLIFLFLTDFVFCTFFALKQCYTCAFSSLLFVLFFQEKFKYKDLICIILVILSCLFHTSGFILIPIFIFLKIFENKKINPYIFGGLLLLLFLVLEPLLNLIAFFTTNILPSISNRIIGYFNNGISFKNINSVFIKGFPFYYITFLSFLNYKKLNKKILHYDKYCVTSIITSFFYLLSAFSYWMYRFTWLFYLPVGILFGIITKEEKKLKIKIFNCILVYGSMIILLIRWLFLIYKNFGGF